jgi:hypothetical protein
MVAVVMSVLASVSHAQFVGDCDGDGAVSIDELIRAVNIALGETELSLCEPLDVNDDGSVDVNELIGAVAASMSGRPTPTPTVTPSPTATESSAQFTTVDFIAVPAGGGVCGASRDAGGAVLKELTCDLLYVGGGGSGAPALNAQLLRARFAVTGCTGSSCTLGATSAQEAAPFDCTQTGCPIGPPVPVTDPLPTCSATNWGGPGEGSVNVADGTASMLLHASAHTWITTDRNSPCPRCVSGTCTTGARAGMPCTTNDPNGLTSDCVPGGTDGSVDIGFINIDVELRTSPQSISSPDGAFCPGQDNIRPGLTGCLGQRTCRSIELTGVPSAGGFLPVGTPHNVRLATVACIPAQGNALVDSSSDLPGPGMETVSGTITLNP